MQTTLKGQGVSVGIGIGKAIVYAKEVIAPSASGPIVAGEELKRFKTAHERVVLQTRELSVQTREKYGESAANIFEAHIAFLEDESGFVEPILEKIGSGMSAVHAVHEIAGGIAALLAASGDTYLKERAADIEDLRDNLILGILGRQRRSLLHLSEPYVLVAEDLTPSDTALLDTERILAIVTEKGGVTGHMSIMAQAMEIPAIVGCAGVLKAVQDGAAIAADGSTGEVVLEPEENALAHYRKKHASMLEDKRILVEYRTLESVTRDGHTVHLYANVGVAKDVERAVSYGAEGVGLVRSEFLYMQKSELPGEEDQFQAYCAILKKAAGRPVIIRTLDAGGDKDLPALHLSQEDNPFLGYRAIRIGLDQKELLITQLRALLRAAAHGTLGIMFPMISSLEELRQAKLYLAEAAQRLESEGVPFGEADVGIMIEIPSAAIMAEELAKEADFFSIGTNDLVQYTIAVDRGNPKVASLYTPYHPAVLKLIASVVEAAHKQGIACGMCGEMAGDALLTPFLLGAGLKEFSMSSALVPRIRRLVRSLSFEECRRAAAEILKKSTAAEVKSYLTEWSQRTL